MSRKRRRVSIILAFILFFIITQPKNVEAHVNDEISMFADPESVPLAGLFKIPSGANSYVSGNKVVITEKGPNQVGSVFSVKNNRMDLTRDFIAEMYIRIDGNADGMTFIMHNDLAAVDNYTGRKGQGLGAYANEFQSGTVIGQVKNSFVIEFDTYYNGDEFDSDVDYNSGRGHVANSYPSLASSYKPNYLGYLESVNHYNAQYPKFSLGDGQWRKLTLQWKKFDSQQNGLLTYKYADLPAISVSINQKLFGTNKVYWGFTGSTGSEYEQAEVLFSSVPGLLYYDDTISIVDEENRPVTEKSTVKNDTKLTVKYSGKYVQSEAKRNLLKPTLKFRLSKEQQYQAGSFSVNGVTVTPTISNNTLSVSLPDLTPENSMLDVSFDVKTNGKSFDKPTVNSNLSGSNYKQNDGKTILYQIDSEPPKGIGKLTIITQGDTESLISLEDYKSLLKDWSDDITKKDKVKVSLKGEQNIDEIVKSLGQSSVILSLQDEAGNVGYVNVPLYIKEKDELVSSDGTYLLAAKNVEILSNEYPETRENLVEKILTDSNAILWKVNDSGDFQQMDAKLINIAMDSLPAPGSFPDPKEYAVNLSYVTEANEVTLLIKVAIIGKKSMVKIEFIDESGKALHDSVTLERDTNTTIDLTKEKEIQEIVQGILVRNYVIDQKPQNETAIPVKPQGNNVQYKFKGRLFVQSFPNYMDFGRKWLGTSFIKVEQVKYDQPLIVWDNRKNKGPWRLTITLIQPLTSQEDPSKVLPMALKYKINEMETVQLLENIPQNIAVRENGPEEQYNISAEWDRNQTGLQLEVPSGKVVQSGKYKATILWQIAQTP